MDKEQKDHRDRLIALGFVSFLLIVIYGPASAWFVAADRFVFDQIATHVEQPSPANSVIVSIDPQGRSAAEIAADYQSLLKLTSQYNAARVIMANPPAIKTDAELTVWETLLKSGPPAFLPSHHALAPSASRSGYLNHQQDPDGILRRSNLWYLNDGVMSPSLPLAIALANLDKLPAANMVRNDAVMFVANYQATSRLSAQELLASREPAQHIAGKTIFIDADPPLVSAAAQLPSRQYVTLSEVTATMLGSIESGRAITAPSWSGVMELLAPAVLAVLAILLLPGHSRRQIVLATGIAILALLALEALLLSVAHTRFDLGRPIVVLMSASLVSAWLAGAVRDAARGAFQRGSDFLSAGRLEPAFAEFRRCQPTESLANAMYKLSLAFEEQAQPERAEAVLGWMKETQGATPAPTQKLNATTGAPRHLGRYVIEKKLGRGAMGAVYLARDPRINRAVALKVIPIEKEFEDEELKEPRLRFFREAES
ncbi:MAG: CHASE2 domain-containing protein, partial [Woeseia sp.]